MIRYFKEPNAALRLTMHEVVQMLEGAVET
jgi:hypothetical protein